MKIKVKFDNTKIKIGYDGKIKDYENKDTQSEPAYIEFDSDFFNIVYQMFPANLISYYNTLSKAFEKSTNAISHAYANTMQHPGTMLANGHDIFNYVARYGSANFQSQSVMRLDGRLDHNTLLKAVRISVDVEPVLGCRFIENEPPYWKRREDIDSTTFCTFEKTNNLDEAIQSFLESPLDMDHDPMVKLKLISWGPYDTLCLKINHACCDGTGIKEYIGLLADIYTQLDQNNGNYVIKPRVRTRKDQDRLFSALGIKDPDAAWSGELDIPKIMWTFPWQQGKSDSTRISLCRLPYGYIDTIHKYGKVKGATINDIILTAFFRAMFEMSQPVQGIPMDISMTVDLRRYLPTKKAEAIRNFSGGVDIKLARFTNESFDGTLSRVISMMKEIKNNNPGIQSAIGLERVERAKFNDTLSFYQTAAQNACYSNQCSPVLSNLGFINKSLLRFGKKVVTDAYIIPPAVCAPGILLCTGTYNGILTLAMSNYESQVRHDDIKKLLQLMKNELIRSCGR